MVTQYVGGMLTNSDIAAAFAHVTTANLADACLRLAVPFAAAPPAVRPLFPEARCAGRVLPVTHFGSVDVFLEALDGAKEGEVLVIDNDNRADEACIGDLTVLEVAAAGVTGVVLWGLHRDTAELLQIRLPVFTTGSIPLGPRTLRPRTTEPLDPCTFAGSTITRDHVVFAEPDGVLFIPAQSVEPALEGARAIADRERKQADAVRAGTTLRQQFQWASYLTTRRTNPAYSLRDHLTAVGGAIEV
jgi:regulator of RNase E activity RraA